MSKMIVDRLKNHNFSYPYQNIIYPNAGHMISADYSLPQEQPKGQLWVKGQSYEFDYGGTPEGDQHGQKDSQAQILRFIEEL